MLSLAKTVFTSLFLESTLLAEETNIVVLEETILEEEKSYSKSVQSEADSWKLCISLRFTLEVLSN